jgi:siroheme synthase-like protein
LSDRLVVIVGGGPVAVRKVAGVMAGGAKKFRVVTPEVDEKMPADVEVVREKYHSKHLQGAGLIFAATDDATVNEAVVRDAKAMNVLVNRADEGEGDFIVPALLREGQSLTIAVSAGGAPALAARVRDEIGRMLDDRWKKLADATHALRPLIMKAIGDSARRREALHDLATEDAAREAAHSEMALRRWLEERYPELQTKS